MSRRPDSEVAVMAAEQQSLKLAENSTDHRDRPVSKEIAGLLWLTVFVFVNAVLFRFSSELRILENAAEDLRYIFGLFFLAAALCLSGSLILFLSRSAWAALRSLSLTPVWASSAAVLLLSAGSLYEAWLDYDAYSLHFGYQPLITVLLLLVLERFVDASFGRQVESVLCFSRGPGVLEAAANGGNSAAPVPPVIAGEMVTLGAGTVIPCDGLVVGGMAELRERKLSGFARVRIAQVNEEVFAGSEIVTGELQIRVGALLDESYLSSFSAELKELSAGSAAERQQWRRAGNLMVVLVFFVAACAAIYWQKQGAGFAELAWVAASVLLVSIFSKYLALLPVVRGLVVALLFKGGALVKNFGVLAKLRRLRALVVEYQSDCPPGELQVHDYSILDDRVDEQSLTGIVLLLLGSVDTAETRAAADFLRSRVTEVALNEVRELQHYPGLGLCGEVQGCEITIGTEDFLLERGVEMQLSELSPAPAATLVYYIALGPEIVARLLYTQPFNLDAQEMLRSLRALKIRPLLLGDLEPEQLKAVGQAAGFKSDDVKAGMSAAEAAALLPEGERAVYSSSTGGQPWQAAGFLSMGVFDELAWDVSSHDVTCFSRNLAVPVSALRLSRCAYQVQLVNLIVSAGGALLLITAAFSGYAGPVAVLLAVLLLSFFMYLQSWSLAGRCPAPR